MQTIHASMGKKGMSVVGRFMVDLVWVGLSWGGGIPRNPVYFFIFSSMGTGSNQRIGSRHR